MNKYRVEVVSDRRCELGEGPHWDVGSQTLYYVDLTAGDVCQLEVESKKSKAIHIGDNVSLVIPTDDNQLIITKNNKLFKFDSASNRKQLLAEVEQDLKGNRFNDGKCDASGRLWLGTMAAESAPGVVAPNLGALYSFEGSQISKRYEPVSLSNGIAWSLDNRTMYFVDSVARVIYAFDFDLKTGFIANPKVLFDFKRSGFESNILPDGMTIDASGQLWVALYNGSQVVRIDPQTGQSQEVQIHYERAKSLI